MAQSSILGGIRAPSQAKGRDADALGPSDTSDSGSDIQGEGRLTTEPDEGPLGGATPTARHSDSDSAGTGERGSAVPDDVRDGADIGTDRVDGGTDAQDIAEVSLDDPDAADIGSLTADDDSDDDSGSESGDDGAL